MSIIQINKDTCLRDGICSATCPVGVIFQKDGEYPEVTATAERDLFKMRTVYRSLSDGQPYSPGNSPGQLSSY